MTKWIKYIGLKALVLTTVLVSYAKAQQPVDASKLATPTSVVKETLDTEKNPITEDIREELRIFHDKVKKLNEECKKKREDLKQTLSLDAKRLLDDRKQTRQEIAPEAK